MNTTKIARSLMADFDAGGCSAKLAIRIVFLFTTVSFCVDQVEASLVVAKESDLAGGELVTFEAPNVVNFTTSYRPDDGGVTFSSDDPLGFIGPTALGFEGSAAPLSISFDEPVFAAHWIEFGGIRSDEVELFSDAAFTTPLSTMPFDISSFAVDEGGGVRFSIGFTSDEVFSSMRLIGSSSTNVDDFRYAAIPEPSSPLMLALALIGTGVLRLVRRYKSLASD